MEHGVGVMGGGALGRGRLVQGRAEGARPASATRLGRAPSPLRLWFPEGLSPTAWEGAPHPSPAAPPSRPQGLSPLFALRTNGAPPASTFVTPGLSPG